MFFTISITVSLYSLILTDRVAPIYIPFLTAGFPELSQMVLNPIWLSSSIWFPVWGGEGEGGGLEIVICTFNFSRLWWTISRNEHSWIGSIYYCIVKYIISHGLPLGYPWIPLGYPWDTLEISTFLGPVKWHRSDRRVPFGAQKSLNFQGPSPSHLTS